jgi:DNA polymerase elongation subunit (family B)
MDKIKVDKTKYKFLREDFPEYATKTEIEEEIKRLDKLSKYYYNKQLSEKTIINASYGALASKYFVGFNIAVASSVTEMGRNITKYGAEILDNYFMNDWHRDTVLHEKLGLLGTPHKLNKSVLRYGDSVEGNSKVNIKYKEYNKDGVIFNDFCKIFVNRNNELEVITANQCKDSDEIINVLDLIETWDKNTCERNLTISELYILNELIYGSYKDIDKEYTLCNVQVSNKNGYEIPQKLIRHKTNKEKWLIKTECGNQVVTTNDHSIMILQDNCLVEKKPIDIEVGNLTLVNDKQSKITYCKNIGSFNNEYVYDIEMLNNKTFYANNILLHNTDSVYFSVEDVFDELFSRKLVPQKYIDDPRQLALDIVSWRLDNYIDQAYDKFAKRFNTKNGQKFELEVILFNAIFLAKKKYVGDIAWKEGDGNVDQGKKLKITGIEIVQSSTPKFCREKLQYLIKYIFANVDNFSIAAFITELNKIKNEFKKQDIELISYSKGITDYNKSVLEDKYELKLEKGCPMHVRAAAYHNYKLFNSTEYKNKYKHIKSSDKVKLYYSKDPECNVFAFLAGNFPYELAPEIDIDMQFEKSIIDPINRLLVPLGYSEVRPNLVTSRALF